MIDGKTYHVSDVDKLDPVEFATTIDLSRRTGVRAVLAAPMLAEGGTVGCILLRKPLPEPFAPRQIELAEAFAAQAVIAIQNVRLFTEIQEKSLQLEVASQHKSQFLANMSHELRTPLNAILGYTEMMVDGLYGDLPEKAQTTLERVQSNGKHLLGLINDVLDLSKIEAGQLVLAAEDYSVADMVSTVMAATESLAKTKKLALEANVAAGLRVPCALPGAVLPGGFEIKIGPLHAFMPKSHSGLARDERPEPLVGRNLTVEVIEVVPRAEKAAAKKGTARAARKH